MDHRGARGGSSVAITSAKTFYDEMVARYEVKPRALRAWCKASAIASETVIMEYRKVWDNGRLHVLFKMKMQGFVHVRHCLRVSCGSPFSVRPLYYVCFSATRKVYYVPLHTILYY